MAIGDGFGRTRMEAAPDSGSAPVVPTVFVKGLNFDQHCGYSPDSRGSAGYWLHSTQPPG